MIEAALADFLRSQGWSVDSYLPPYRPAVQRFCVRTSSKQTIVLLYDDFIEFPWSRERIFLAHPNSLEMLVRVIRDRLR